jgi:hypothetical protein
MHTPYILAQQTQELPDKINELYGKGVDLYNLGKYDEAITLINIWK